MIDWFIDTFLGVWGRAAVDFYGTYALPINSAVVIYGTALVVWHRRLNPYRAAAVEQARRLIGTSRARPDDRMLQQRVAAAFDWEQVAALGQGRLVAGPMGSSGKVTLPIHVAVMDNDNALYSKTINYTAEIPPGETTTQFLFTDDDIQVAGGSGGFTIVQIGFEQAPQKPAKGEKPARKKRH